MAQYRKKPVRKKLPARRAEPPEKAKNVEYYEKSIRDARERREGPPLIPMAPKRSAEIKKENLRRPPAEREPLHGGKRRARPADAPPASAAPGRAGSSAEQREQPGGFQVIDGGEAPRVKRKKRLRWLRTAIVAAILIGTLVVLNLQAPSGLVEWSQNYFASLGSGGGYPVDVPGARSLGMYAQGDRLFVLEDTSAYAYNSSAKQITGWQHGFTNPVMEPSASRVLTYDRGGTGLRVDNLDRNLTEQKLDHAILTADLCDSGRMAVVTKAEGYAAQLLVYNKNFEVIFKWSSAENQISSVCLNPKGTRVAAAVVGSKDGVYASTVYLFDVKKPEPVATLQFDDTLVVSLSAKEGGRVCAAGNAGLTSFAWDGSGRTEQAAEALQLVDQQAPDRVLTVDHPGGNVQTNRVSVLDSSLKEQFSFQTGGEIRTACVSGDAVYLLVGNTLSAYDRDGLLLERWETGYEGARLSPYRDGAALLADLRVTLYRAQARA